MLSLPQDLNVMRVNLDPGSFEKLRHGVLQTVNWMPYDQGIVSRHIAQTDFTIMLSETIRQWLHGRQKKLMAVQQNCSQSRLERPTVVGELPKFKKGQVQVSSYK